MKVKILEETGVKHSGVHYESGDEVTVPDDVGAMFCENGWAEDTGGQVETGERKFQDNVTLAVDDSVVDHDAEDAG